MTSALTPGLQSALACQRWHARADLGRIALREAYDGDIRAFEADGPEHPGLASLASLAGETVPDLAGAVRVWCGITPPPRSF